MSGQDADVAALQRVAAGDQAVSVWKDALAGYLGRGGCRAARRPVARLADVEGTGEFVYTNKESGAETVLTSILPPIPITQDNLNEVTDAGWISVEELCSTGGGRPLRLRRGEIDDVIAPPGFGGAIHSCSLMCS